MSSKLLVLRMMAVIGLAIALVGCNATPTAAPTTPPLPTATTQPTINPQPTYNAIQTQAAQTVVANLTQNAPTAAPLKPTSTAAPTTPPTPTTAPAAANPTSAPTPAKAQATPTTVPSAAPAQNNYACVLMDVSPKQTVNILPGADFDAYWTVMNTGTDGWTPQDVKVRFMDGVNLRKHNDSGIVSLNTVVLRGEKYTVGVDMLAPAQPGIYQSNWAIVQGSRTLCNLNLTIVVRQPTAQP